MYQYFVTKKNLLKGNGYKIEQCLHNYRIFFKKAIKDALNNGRPKNGMFIAVLKKFKGCAKEMPRNHWMLQAVTLIVPNNRILILNSLIPAINDIVENAEFSTVVWTDDINANFLRNTKFTKIVDKFIEEKMFCKAWERFPIDFTHF